jgi:hypothetical protein
MVVRISKGDCQIMGPAYTIARSSGVILKYRQKGITECASKDEYNII